MTFRGAVLIFLLIWGPAWADELPEAVQSYLQQHYKKCTLSPINREAAEYFKAAGWHGSPNFFSYDFDGDRADDFALQIRCPENAEWEDADLVLLQRGQGLKEQVLERHPADVSRRSLHFMRPILIGEALSDRLGKPIPFKNYGIELIHFQKNAAAFFFAKESFSRTPTLDLK